MSQQAVAMLLNARGDYLLNLPALRALAALHPGTLSLVSRPGARAALFPDLPLARVVEPRIEFSTEGHRFDARQLAESLGECETFLSLNPWRNACTDQLLAKLTPARSVGFHDCYSHPLPLDFGKHSAELAFDVPRALEPTLDLNDFCQPPRLHSDHERLADRLVSLLPPRARLLAVHGETKPDKEWPAERFRKLICWFLRRDARAYVFDLGLGPETLGCRCHEERVIPCQQLVLAAAVALVGRCQLFVGVDSCFLHAADLYRVPGVGIFGPTTSQEFGFRLSPHRHIDWRGSLDTLPVSTVATAVEDLERETALAPARELCGAVL